MTIKEYKNYIKSVDDFFKKENINNLSQITDDDGYCESYFSNINCDCCNRSLGGDRYDCNGYNEKDNKIYEYSICIDCVYYCEFGEIA